MLKVHYYLEESGNDWREVSPEEYVFAQLRTGHLTDAWYWYANGVAGKVVPEFDLKAAVR